jgi:hypothetical protein
MEYVITADRPFHEIEAQTTGALEQRGFVVQCTFSLASIVTAGLDGNSGGPGYTVLLLYKPGVQLCPVGQVILYEQRGQRVLKSMLRSPAANGAGGTSGTADVEAELAVALSLAGLDFCVHAAGGTDCIDPGHAAEGQ